ncbi:MAG: hypothetical protein E5V17_02605 [Mesorhizobium sp.]|uniref:hypothetical protein n=1 Tax=Mesorhizobium sp. TaxID=1871066 RepID=UPI000FE8A70E|nr:hypothetical protein [Mesorhizobium sp.]RWA61042.1 MAG: hypothetical protein EOQ27_21055 [Mesorhizobium sp.]RWC95098.1 MAG: hypothetical protein EOS32_14290 [Mesorhizobium sp.]TIW71167.1 MAG: hypothetical protein E5V58_20100 [Mesorhizobium sp.]TIX96840.1 MAG: hypothetical protein E5V17_02605 [Mesorhizobium sp.]
MAETDDQSSTPKMTQREAQEALEKQVAQLKREINKINRTLSERAEEALEEANGWYDSAADRASRTAQALRSRAQSVSGVVQENPGTVSTAFVLGGMIGLMLGLILTGADDPRRGRWL